jgi:hypothetical protein
MAPARAGESSFLVGAEAAVNLRAAKALGLTIPPNPQIRCSASPSEDVAAPHRTGRLRSGKSTSASVQSAQAAPDRRAAMDRSVTRGTVARPQLSRPAERREPVDQGPGVVKVCGRTGGRLVSSPRLNDERYGPIARQGPSEIHGFGAPHASAPSKSCSPRVRRRGTANSGFARKTPT